MTKCKPNSPDFVGWAVYQCDESTDGRRELQMEYRVETETGGDVFLLRYADGTGTVYESRSDAMQMIRNTRRHKRKDGGMSAAAVRRLKYEIVGLKECE